MLIHMRQPFFSIANATIFLVLGIFFGGASIAAQPVAFADLEMGVQISWVITGVCFVMAYFSLVHLKYKD